LRRARVAVAAGQAGRGRGLARALTLALAFASGAAGCRCGAAGTGADAGAPGGDAAAPDAAADAAAADAAEAPLALRTFTPTAPDVNVLNPERGFMDAVDLAGGGDFSAVRAAGRTLAYAGVHLDAYRTAPLDAPFLAALDAGFADVRAAGIKVVLRFVYNDGPWPVSDPDASLAQVLAHLDQLAPVLAANADVIAVMQAGFIGAWGEWHTSTNGLDDPADEAAVLAAILAALPASRAAAVRTPMAKADTVGGPVADADAWNGTPVARVGHHNDCFLSSPDDFGTYAAPIDTWKDFVAQDGRFLPNGGETCATDPPRSDCPESTTEMARLHWSYLNALYNPDVLAGWTLQGCMDAVAATLGYRLVLVDASYSSAVAPGGAVRVALTIRNDGWAALFNARPVEVVLDDGTGARAALLAAVDPRTWEPGASVTVSARLRVPAAAAPGLARLALRLPDEAPALHDRSDYAVAFASEGVWDASLGANVFALDLAIDPAAPGDVDPTAAEFAEIQ